MSCGGAMMRAPFQPLAHMVDAIAEKWCATDSLSAEERAAVRAEILNTFDIGEKPELTFHGLRYLLTVSRDETDGEFTVSVHKISAES